MDISQIGTEIAIVVICYLIGMGIKLIPNVINDAIPFLVGVSGGILGVIGYFVMPNFPANDVVNAIAVGIVSGLASTGANQLGKWVKS